MLLGAFRASLRTERSDATDFEGSQTWIEAGLTCESRTEGVEPLVNVGNGSTVGICRTLAWSSVRASNKVTWLRVVQQLLPATSC